MSQLADWHNEQKGWNEVVMSIVNEASRSVIGCVCSRKWRIYNDVISKSPFNHTENPPELLKKKQAKVYLCRTFKNNQRAEPAERCFLFSAVGVCWRWATLKYIWLQRLAAVSRVAQLAVQLVADVCRLVCKLTRIFLRSFRWKLVAD